jgi:hypothetical protein
VPDDTHFDLELNLASVLHGGQRINRHKSQFFIFIPGVIFTPGVVFIYFAAGPILQLSVQMIIVDNCVFHVYEFLCYD